MFNLTDNSWTTLKKKEEMRSAITGEKLNHVLMPRMNFGQSMTSYSNYLILFGGNEAVPQAVKSRSG